MQASRVAGLLKSRISDLQEAFGTFLHLRFFPETECLNWNKAIFLEKFSPAGRNCFPQLNETGVWVFLIFFIFFLPDSLEGYFWSQAYDSMPYQTTLKTKIPSSQESCYCLTGQSVATANVTSSIGCGGVWKPTEF